MRIALLISIPLFVLGIALAGAHILVERLIILIGLVMFLNFFLALLGIFGLKGSFINPVQHPQAGVGFQVEAVTENRAFLPKAFIKLLLKTSSPQKRKDVLINLPARGTCHWDNHLSFPQRGYHKIGPLLAEATDPFGLFRLHRQLERETKVLIYPTIVELPLFRAESEAESGVLRNRLANPEADGVISGIREYVPGDSLSRIHWRSSAHMAKLIVKEFDADLSEKVWVVPDLSKAANYGTGIESTQEYIITITASLIKKYSDSGRKVGMIAQNDSYHFYAARPGNLNMWRIMETLALVKANGQVSLYRLLDKVSNQFVGNSIAIIVTAAANDELVETILKIKKRGAGLVAILIDAASFGGGVSSQKIKSRLDILNIPNYSVKQGDNVAEALNSQGQNSIFKANARAHYFG